MIHIASDHAGFKMKEFVKEYFQINNIAYFDLGCDSEDSCDYPDFAHKLAKKIIEDSVFGIAICGTGIGISIALNRHKGIRAARCLSVDDAFMARLHNNANILVLAGRQTEKK